MNDPMPPLSGLSPVAGKKVVVKFDGGLLSSDGGILVLREVEQRLRVADRMAACLVDPRAPDQITHTLAAIMRFRLLMIAAGYEDGNDADTLRGDPMFKMALDLLPSDRELCSQPTISRLENLPDARALLRLGRAMVDLYCESFHQVPGRITLAALSRSCASEERLMTQFRDGARRYDNARPRSRCRHTCGQVPSRRPGLSRNHRTGRARARPPDRTTRSAA